MILLMLHVNINKLHVFLFFFHIDCQECFDEPATPTPTPTLKNDATFLMCIAMTSTYCCMKVQNV